MVISRRRFAENLKEMRGIKKEHVKGVQNFCFCELSMQILWRRRCSRVVDLKLPIREVKRIRRLLHRERQIKIELSVLLLFHVGHVVHFSLVWHE